MKLNRFERWVVNNPLRVIMQKSEILWMQRAFPLPAGATVAEIGCGRGAGAKGIIHKYRPAHLHALDLDVDMLRTARRYLAPIQPANITLTAANACRLPFRSNSLDAVFGFGFLHHVPNWQKALSEIARVLRNQGVYYLEELYPSVYQNALTKRLLLHPPENRFQSEELRAALQNARLHFEHLIDIPRIGILAAAVKGG
jgi:ubiquinone/menaquinone biosynthesis C-methylase UbiE